MQTGNPLDEFLSLLSQTMPGLTVSVDRHPGAEDKAAWIEISGGKLPPDLEVEYRPGQGFGLHLDDLPFSGPGEIYATPAEVLARLQALAERA